VVRGKDTSGHHRLPGIPSPNASFDGIGATLYAPPDTMGAAGTTQYFQMVNVRIAVYDKTGTILYGPVNSNTLWSGFGGGCQTNNDGDGFVLWDTMAQRWVISQFSVSTKPYLQCVAVSTTTDATGTYNRYSFTYTNFPDYPKMGIWPDAYYASFNLFNDAGTLALGTELCAYNRSAMLAGAAATQQCFQPYLSGTQTQLPASLDGATQPPSGEKEYFVGLSTNANKLAYFKFHVDWGTPGNTSLTGPTDLAVTAFSPACGGGACIPQSGTAQLLDSLGDRVMSRLAYRNLGTSESLVVTHSIVAGSSVGARWYELRVSGGNLTVFQQGTYAPDTAYRWMGSMAIDQAGNIALGYSVSSSSLHPGIRYTGRVPGDPLGQMPQGEATVFTGNGSQTGGLVRWGDYSAMAVDPVDDCTFWYTNEYIPSNGSFNWHTRIAAFKFDTCGVGGSSAVPSDFNGDGYGDLAVGVPYEDAGGFGDSGAVSVLYGSASGLSSTGNQWFDEAATGSASDATGDTFGWSTSTGDFNGDGFADLAIGVPFKEVSAATDAGAVSILYGSSTGLDAAGSQQWNQNLLGTDPAETGDAFGASVAAGDVNGDGYDDLAVGVPGEGVGSHSTAGAVNIVLGSAAGLSAAGAEFWNQDSPNINNTAETDDEFGLSVAFGDFDGNGFADLAAGVPYEDLTHGVDAGAVNVIYGSASGLTSVADDFWNQDVDGINNVVEKADLFGYSVGAGDFDGDGFDDLMAGVPLEDLSGGADAGAVNVIYGTASGLDDPGDQFWHQDSSGINNEAEAGDEFAFAVSAGDFDSDGFDDAALGVPGEDISGAADAGGVSVIYGKSTGLNSSGDDFWHQNSSGIDDTAEAGDIFGIAVTAANFGNGPQDDLASGIQWEDVGSIVDAGAASVIYGSPSDLTATGDQFWNQDSAGILDQAEVGDDFGWGLGEPGVGHAGTRPLSWFGGSR
jgi:hypothetical protein